MKKKIWFVNHPLSLYTEDVKALARKADLEIVDAKFRPKHPDFKIVEQDPPKLVTFVEFAKKEKEAAAKLKAEEEKAAAKKEK